MNILEYSMVDLNEEENKNNNIMNNKENNENEKGNNFILNSMSFNNEMSGDKKEKEEKNEKVNDIIEKKNLKIIKLDDKYENNLNLNNITLKNI